MDLSTRSGVRCKPSRCGSSPSREIISLTREAISWPFGGITLTLVDFIGINFKDVPCRLADAIFPQLRPPPRNLFFPFPLHPAENLVPKIPRRGPPGRKTRHFHIQIPMI